MASWPRSEPAARRGRNRREASAGLVSASEIDVVDT
jgi:hypothetical protein